MRFLLRCMFWLSIVYTSILTNAGGRVAPGGPVDLAATARAAIAAPADAVARQAAAGLAAYCRRDAGTCLADSARLTALVAASTDDVSQQAQAAPVARRPDPRHRARGAMATRMP